MHRRPSARPRHPHARGWNGGSSRSNRSTPSKQQLLNIIDTFIENEALKQRSSIYGQRTDLTIPSIRHR
jgi:hypothetical protein